jgi:hypothetical protein
MKIAILIPLLISALTMATALPAQDLGVVDTIEWDSIVGPVSFPHRLHVEDLEIECSDCHHETDAGPLTMPHPEYFDDFWIECGSCHQSTPAAAAPRACSQCHHASPVTIADETLSSKVVVHRSCWSCHDITTGAEASRGCAACHERPAG